MAIALPDRFVDRMKVQLGPEAEAFFTSLGLPALTSIRLHHQKGRHDFTDTTPVAWCPQGLYLAARPAFHLDPHWHSGAYYVQEASSMLLDEVIRQLPVAAEGKIWLDLCAAPGGKTGILAAHMRPGDVLVANEVIRSRRQVLEENLVKGGFPNIFLTGLPTEYFHRPMADIVLVDAPCAGEGMMRKDPEAVRQWTPHLVESCTLTQQRIVADAVRALRSGGYLIYSTCSYSEAENIRNVESFVRAHSLESISLDFPEDFQIATLAGKGAWGYQAYPHRVAGEGLFFAVLRRQEFSAPRIPKSRHQAIRFSPLSPGLKAFTTEAMPLLGFSQINQTAVISEFAIPQFEIVRDLLPGGYWLPEVGCTKGRDDLPSHWLAMSPWRREEAPSVGLDLPGALDFLERKIPGALPTGSPDWYTATFRGSVLGWLKLTTQGWRNHYPTAWRLRQRPG